MSSRIKIRKNKCCVDGKRLRQQMTNLILDEVGQLEIEQAPLSVLKLVDEQVAEDIVEVEAAVQKQTVRGVIVDRRVARSTGKRPNVTPDVDVIKRFSSSLMTRHNLLEFLQLTTSITLVL
jgi:hypothetical protein